MWESIIPPGVRLRTKELFTNRQKRPANPASYFIWIYILIGSQAIRIISVKNDHTTFSRKAELQIEKLREVIRKLQAGEEVDVEKVLGTGVPEEEDAWEQALKELENEERIWTQSRAKKRQEREARERQREQEEREREDASPVNPQVGSVQMTNVAGIDRSKPSFSAPGFF